MRYIDFKLTEAVLNAKSLLKYGNDDRLNALLNLIKSGATWTTTDGKKFVIDREFYSNSKNIQDLEKEIKAQAAAPQQKPFYIQGFLDGAETTSAMPSSSFPKPAGTGARASSEDDLSNVGEIAEILHAAAVYARLLEGTNSIDGTHLQRILDQLDNGNRLQGKAEDIKSKDFDKFSIMVRASKDIWKDIKRKDILQHPKIKSLVANSIIPDANDNTGEYAKTYATNGEYDEVEVIGDGLSDQKGTKADIVFKNKVTGREAKFSLKANTTRELHQHGLGPVNAPMTKRFEIAKDFFDGINVDVAGEGGLAQQEFEQAEDIFTANVLLFRQAYTDIKNKFQGDLDRNEKVFMTNFLQKLKEFARRDEDGLDVKQFTSKGYYVLDMALLDKLVAEKDFNFVVEYGSGKHKSGVALPKIVFKTPDGGEFVTIRTYASTANPPYMRIKVDKGSEFVSLTTKKSNIESKKKSK